MVLRTLSSSVSKPIDPQIIEAVKKFGPIPPGWRVATDKAQLVFIPPDRTAEAKTSQHPFELQKHTRLVSDYPPEEDIRPHFPGQNYPPAYHSSLFNWEPKKDALKALFHGLVQSGADIDRPRFKTEVEFWTNGDGQTQINNDTIYSTLYHALDRNHYVVNPDEAILVGICKHFERDLVVVCPEQSTDLNWHFIYEGDPDLRPPIRARWSVGYQDIYRPVYIGYLPTSAMSFKWYTVLPTKDYKEEWEKLWTMPELTKEYLASFLLPDPEDGVFDPILDIPMFEWLLVSLQKTISLGGTIPDDQTGNWMHQYGRHLHRTGRRCLHADSSTIEEFEFDPEQPYSGANVTLEQVSGWMRVAPTSSNFRDKVKAWDEGILGMYEFSKIVAKEKIDKEDLAKAEEWKMKWEKIREIYPSGEEQEVDDDESIN